MRSPRAPSIAPFLHPASDSMVPPFDSEPMVNEVFVLPAVALLGLAALSGCTSDSGPPAQPSFYASMADAGATVDAAAAASMISGYRGNNGLGVVEVDPDLMRMAMDHARVMAAKDKIDRSAGREFTGRLATSGFDGKLAVENVGAGYHTLAEAFSGWRELSPAPRQHAQGRRQPVGHRRRLCAAVEVQGVLGADHGGEGRNPRVRGDLSAVMPALVAGIHVLLHISKQGEGGRNKSGHDKS